MHGETLSRVDELLAHNVGTELKSWKAKQFDKYNNISRWFDHVQVNICSSICEGADL